MTAPTQPEDSHLEAAFEDRQSFLQIPGAVEDFEIYGDDEDWEEYDDE